ncbi:MAG: hypothetical protein U9Q81_20405 [Pseudomonadota bacterium]|nr:hypothetical protein [Pseudomonadota bacterium]
MTAETPSGQLADTILDKLIDNGLVLEKNRKRLRDNLANGRLKAEDWRLAIELAITDEDHP